MTDLTTATSRLREFSKTWNDDDCIDEQSKLTGADLAVILRELDRRADAGTLVSDKPLP